MKVQFKTGLEYFFREIDSLKKYLNSLIINVFKLIKKTICDLTS